jgi:hypothetical protein
MRKFLALCMSAALVLPGCVEVDNSLGEGLVDNRLLYKTYTAEFPLEEIQMKMADALSGYSSSKLTIGAIRDDVFGLTTREAAFPLVPALDTLDLGTNPSAVSLTLRFSADTVSCNEDAQARILQNIRVTELTQRLPVGSTTSCTQDIPHGTTPITQGTPVYSGSGDLSLTFTKAYAQKYVDALRQLGPTLRHRDEDNPIDKYEDWLNAVPGIYLSVDAPQGNGGRINLFNFSSLSVSSNYYTRNDNVGLLTVHSTWRGVEKDSTFLFYPGETEFADEATLINSNTKFDQYCFNRTTHSTAAAAASNNILVEGGGGLKPVILASELQRKAHEAVAREGGDPSKVVIVKASIILPFDMPEDYRELKYYPSVLSPTIQTKSEDEEGTEYISFAGLTDASVSSENQGDIDRSNLQYAPDITYHLQAMMDRTDLATSSDSDIWLLTIHTEKVANANGSLYDNSYYQQLMYASYYESLYGGYGGYGGYGYGGYGGYGNYGYSNYYNYMMLAQMMSASTQQSYSYTTELDKDRYYRAVLCGPGSSDRKPKFRITFAIQQQ